MTETRTPPDAPVHVAMPLRGFLALGHTLREAVERVVSSGRYVQGSEHAAFEKEFAEYLGVEHCLGVASGTDALQLALAALQLDSGSEVVTAANAGGYATAALRRVGLQPRYADVDPDTLGLSAASVEAALTPETGAVVVTHLYGLMCEVEAIAELCNRHGVAVLEDCAQAAGAQRGGRRAGTFGDAAAFSFYPTKNLACLGDGGAVVTARDDVAERVRSLRQYGWGEKYRVERAGGWNSRLDELQAAVLRVGLTKLDAANARRREIASRYAAALPAHAGVLVARESEDYVAHLAVIVCCDRGATQAQLTDAGIGTDVHYPVADHQQPAWQLDCNLPVTEHAVAHVLTVPCYPELTDAEVERVCEALDAL